MEEKKARKILPYNSEMERLRMPEYGRNIQRLIDECLKIEDREERTRFAKSVAGIAASLLPDHVGENGNMKKIWDHLNLISGFKLDIDFPCEVVGEDMLTPQAAPIPRYGTTTIRKQYGRLIESMIDVVSDMEGGPEKDELISRIANQMKKQLMIHNPEGVNDARVINDLNEMSKGRIAINPETYKLREFAVIEPESPVKKKKKKINFIKKRF